MAGRPPKPSALKLVSGNPGKRAVSKQEPDPAYLADLTAPDWMPEGARKVWDEIVPHLRQARLLSTIDVPMLAMGCCSIDEYRQAARLVDKRLLVKGQNDTGFPTINPALIVKSMAFKQAMAVFQQFGMSPAARTRIAVQPQGDLFAGNGKEAASTYFS
jgi:P27 family predicted phage terminase small subunit